MEKYHYDLLKKISDIYKINYNEIIKKIPFKQKRELPEYNIFLHEYKLKSLKELQDIAIQHNCSKSGKKENIIKRIYDYLSKNDSNENTETSIDIDTNNTICEKKDICVGTDNINEVLKIVDLNDSIVQKNEDNNNKYIDISDRDLILLLQTHDLSISGSRTDLINRLKDFYKNSLIKNKGNNIDEYLLEIENDEYISRHEINDKLMDIIQNGTRISICNNIWDQNNIDNKSSYYILIPNKNWIFKETDLSYEFIGIANNDNTFVKCEIPDELLLISS
jgi:hypothetical protein